MVTAKLHKLKCLLQFSVKRVSTVEINKIPKPLRNLELMNLTFSNFCFFSQVLRLSGNQLNRLPTITFIRNPKLKFVDLSTNRLRTIPRDGLVGSPIEILNLSSNQFVTIPVGALSQVRSKFDFDFFLIFNVSSIVMALARRMSNWFLDWLPLNFDFPITPVLTFSPWFCSDPRLPDAWSDWTWASIGLSTWTVQCSNSSRASSPSTSPRIVSRLYLTRHLPI